MLFSKAQLTITTIIQYMELINVVIEWYHGMDFSKAVTVC